MTAVAIPAIEALDEGISLTPQVQSIDFVGPGVVASNVGGAVTVTVNAVPTSPGGAVNSIQFNDGGSFNGFGTWDGSRMVVPGGIELNTLTDGLVLPALTTAQRTALTNEAGLIVFDTDIGQVHQNTGAGWTIPGAGLTTLQGAYDNDPTGAQILLDNVPNPFTVQAAVAGTVVSWLDVAGNPIFTINADPDTVTAEAGVTILNSFVNAGASHDLTLNNTFTQTGGFVGGGILSNGTVTTGVSTTWIWALLQESKLYRININPAFAAFTLFNAIPSIENEGNFNLVQGLILNNGLRHARRTSGTSTVIQTIGLSNAPQSATTVAGAVLTRTTGIIAVNDAPTWNTVAGSTVNLGTVTGLRVVQPAQALFGSSAGTENITARIGVDWINHTFGGASATSAVVRSNQAAGTNRTFFNHTGTARSVHVGDIYMQADFPNGNIRFGASQDTVLGYVGGATNQFYLQMLTPAVSQMRWASPSADRFVISHALNQGEFNIQCDRFSLGQSAGPNGNQVGNFVTPARTIGVAGEWADFLLTQGGNLTVDGNNMSRVSAWVINGVSYASSSGTVTNAETLTVGGMVTSSPGVTITERQSLHVIGGRSRFKSVMQYDSIDPSALAAGDNDNWGGLLTGSNSNNMRFWARITGNATTSVITGIASTVAQDGDSFQLTNVGTETIILEHQGAGSSASNRIITPTGRNFVLREGNTVEVRWDETTDRWRIVSAQINSGTLSGEWQFDSTTTMADPGAGEFRNNNATIGSVTAIAIADETKPGADAGGILAALANGDQLYVQNIEDASEFLVFDITSNTDNTGWHQIGGTVNASGSNFTDGKEFLVTAIFA